MKQPFIFSPEWFEDHQKKLIWLANNRFTKLWFRWILRIHNDVRLDQKINRIEPNCFTYGGKKLKDGRIQLTTDFRTHNKFSKRLYHAFKPLWYIAHVWDIGIANPLIPAWNLGFDTLTVYPDAGSGGGNVTADAQIVRGFVEESWATITGETGQSVGNSLNNDSHIQIWSHATTDRWTRLLRSIYTFDTSSLTSSASISAAILSLYGTDRGNSLGIDPDIDIYVATPADDADIAAADFTQIGTASQTGTAITYAGWNVAGYNDFVFNTFANISLIGVSGFGSRNANYDVSGTPPSWSGGKTAQFQAYYADQTGTANDPKLVTDYLIVVSDTSKFFSLF